MSDLVYQLLNISCVDIDDEECSQHRRDAAKMIQDFAAERDALLARVEERQVQITRLAGANARLSDREEALVEALVYLSCTPSSKKGPRRRTRGE